MKVINAYPPNYDTIKEVFPLVPYDALFAYGDTIYNPSGREIMPDQELHEQVHARQQGDTPDLWYARYLTDPAFRLAQELEAYGEQYAFAKKHVKVPQLLKWARENMAFALSGPAYGSLISFGEAESKIRNYQPA